MTMELFANEQTDFLNDSQTALTQDWVLEEQFTSSIVIHTPGKIQVSASFDFSAAGESLMVDASNDSTIGESTTISKFF